MRKSKSEKGITLIALIITVVVLMILASVAITSIQNDGIIAHAQNAVDQFSDKQAEEQSLLNNYLAQLEEELGGGDTPPAKLRVTDVKNTVLSTTENKVVYDEYDNKIVVPAGFMIKVDDSTNNADDVTEGIVIEDGTKDAEGNATATTGNQFVWIPVGAINHLDEEGKETTTNITLGRYTFDSSTAEPSAYSGSNTEDTVASHNSSYVNKIARDIEAFIASTDPTTGNGGYYIGRYEARTNNTTGRSAATNELTAMTTIKTNAVYNYVTQAQASSLSQGMYADGYKTDGTGTFSSDLTNSYAWDTAILFLQTFDNRENKTKSYSIQNSRNSGLSVKGTTVDVICNVYDMASNCYEWSTESSSRGDAYYYRGGSFYSANRTASTRERKHK